MKVCELIEWLKRQDSLADVQIEVLDPDYQGITTYASDIERIVYLGEYLNTVRIVGKNMAKMSIGNKNESNTN